MRLAAPVLTQRLTPANCVARAWSACRSQSSPRPQLESEARRQLSFSPISILPAWNFAPWIFLLLPVVDGKEVEIEVRQLFELEDFEESGGRTLS